MTNAPGTGSTGRRLAYVADGLALIGPSSAAAATLVVLAASLRAVGPHLGGGGRVAAYTAVATVLALLSRPVFASGRRGLRRWHVLAAMIAINGVGLALVSALFAALAVAAAMGAA